jgi:drug/metabolite transporter (DMT)-like permease
MTWLIIALAGYFLLALVSSLDKFLLSGGIPNPKAYAFYIGLLGMLAFVAAPFGFYIPSIEIIIIALVSGFIFIWALYVFYSALAKGEASRIVPIVGGLSPIFVLILSTIFLKELLGGTQIAGFIFLVAGGLSLSLTRKKGHEEFIKNIRLVIIAAILFAVASVTIKYVYDATGFINGFLWARLGGLLFIILMILPKNVRRQIFAAPAKAGTKLSGVYLTTIALGAAASILIQYAVSLGSVSLVTAAQGTEYAFLFLILAIFSRKFPQIFKEHLRGQTLLQKIFGIMLVAAGLIFLTI